MITILWLLASLTEPLPGNGSIELTVRDKGGEPVHDARVWIVELKRSAPVGEDGIVVIESVPEGTWKLRIESADHGTKQVTDVVVVEGKRAEVAVVFDIVYHEQVTVTATADPRSISDVAQAVDVLNELELETQLQPSIGETLASQPGVSASSFGSASSRPIIRGLGGDRIRVLEAGLETGDASTTSADHAVAVDMSTSQRVEILRGPASLRYGSSAVGGVVNVLDGRIPESLSTTPFTGELSLRGNTAADEEAASVVFDGSQGQFAWHADFSSVLSWPLRLNNRASKPRFSDALSCGNMPCSRASGSISSSISGRSNTPSGRTSTATRFAFESCERTLLGS